MFCTYCKQTRPENEAPCPNCGAPSSLLQISGLGQWSTNNATGQIQAAQPVFTGNPANQQDNSWGGPVTGTNYPTKDLRRQSLLKPRGQSQSASPIQPAATTASKNVFEVSPSLNPSWQQLSPVTTPSQQAPIWSNNGANPQTDQQPAAPQSLLPMLYQESPAQTNDGRSSTVALQLIPENAVEHLLPSMPEIGESVYVPPLYTKARPLIPKYRVISGALSVLIVALLICGGAGYYAKISGKLDAVTRLFTSSAPPVMISQGAPRLADPPNKIDSGPAANIIPSGTTTLRIDKNNVALETDRAFLTNQVFYVAYSVQPPAGQSGKVTIKWYMNGQIYSTVTSNTVIKGGTIMNGSVEMVYRQPAEGSVEIDWNGQFGERFYFVVRPA